MRIVGVSLFGLLASGCGGGTAPVSLSDFPARSAAAQCKRVFRCCTETQIQAIYGTGITDENTCIYNLTLEGQISAMTIGMAQATGHVRYDGEAAGACFEKLGTAPCTAESNDQSVVPECNAYIVPLVPVGDTCQSDLDCQSGWCDRLVTTTNYGMCLTVPTKGMACTSRCVAGATCDTVAGMCVDPKPDGSSCVLDEECLSGNCDNPNRTGGTCITTAVPTCGPAAA